MDTDKINKDLKDVQFYAGCVSSDSLPLHCSDAVFVVNTDKSTEPGEHWGVVGVLSRIGFYFSSFGNQPTESQVVKFLKSNADCWLFSNKRLQSTSSSTCGLYCVMLIKAMAQGLSLQDFLNIFDESSPDKNDMIVEQMYDEAGTRSEITGIKGTTESVSYPVAF